MNVPISITINGRAYTHQVEPRLLLVHYLRNELGLTGTNIGCDTSQCGTCTVLMDGMAVKSCTVLAAQADGSEIKTIEGLATDGQAASLAGSLWEKHGLQCGYCTWDDHDCLRSAPT
jgi:carbon-monoxide dehydrogenase small subunit